MKIDQSTTEQKIIDFEDKKDERFWDDIGKYIAYGIPAYDKKGHTSEIRVRVRPVQLDMINTIAGEFEDNFWKGRMSLYRSILAVGCRTILEYLKKDMDIEVDDLLFMLNGLNKLAKKDRLDEFFKDARKFENSLAENSEIYNEDAKKFFDQVYKRLNKMKQK